jgi:Tol biopolymer transport system component
MVSPDGTRLLVQDAVDTQGLWLIDLQSGERHNLTENYGRIVCCAVWWPSRPDWILLSSQTPGGATPESSYLTAARLDGQELRVLDLKNQLGGLPAPSPDGHTIAYEGGDGSAWLYYWNDGSQQIDPQAYGLGSKLRIGSPAWAPSGKHLAWYAGGNFSQGWRVGLAIIDLQAKTGRFLHLYPNVGREGWFSAPIWSPDGQWLAFFADDQDETQRGLWISKADGRVEHLITWNGMHVYGLPVWSPDSHWLVSGRTLYEIGTGQSQLLDLPLDAEVVAWVTPASQ